MMKPPKGYWTLWEVIHGRLLPYLKASIHPGMLNPVFGLPPPKDIPPGPQASPNESYWMGWMQEFSEINASFDRLSQALVYLTHLPTSKAFRFQRLSEGDWLRY